MDFFRKYYVGYILSKFCLEWNIGELDVIMSDLEVVLRHTKGDENIELMKSTCRSFLKVLEDNKLYYAYSLYMLNFNSAFLKWLKLLKSISLKRKIKFVFLPILIKFSTCIPNITI